MFERPSRERRLRGHRWSKRTLFRAFQPLSRSGPARSARGRERPRQRGTARSRGGVAHPTQRAPPTRVARNSIGRERCESISNDRRLAGGARRFVGRARGSDGLGRRRRATLLPSGPAATHLAGTAGREARDRMNDRERRTKVSVQAEEDVRKAGAEAEARWQNRDEVAGHRGSWPRKRPRKMRSRETAVAAPG
jgi:hypothetical protein